MSALEFAVLLGDLLLGSEWLTLTAKSFNSPLGSLSSARRPGFGDGSQRQPQRSIHPLAATISQVACSCFRMARNVSQFVHFTRWLATFRQVNYRFAMRRLAFRLHSGPVSWRMDSMTYRSRPMRSGGRSPKSPASAQTQDGGPGFLTTGAGPRPFLIGPSAEVDLFDTGRLAVAAALPPGIGAWGSSHPQLPDGR